MSKYIFAGLQAGLLLAGVFLIYMLLRGKTLVAFFKDQDEGIAHMPARMLFCLTMLGFVGAAFLFGALACLLNSWVASGHTFAVIGLGLAILLSMLAVVSRTPLIADKIVWNFAVGGILGIFVPLFATL